MQLIGKSNKEICFLLCVIDISSKSTEVVPLKNEKLVTMHLKLVYIIVKYNNTLNN